MAAIHKKMVTAINKQINAELYSSYLYLAMAAYFEEQGLSGMSKWMQAQAREENVHAMKFFGYVVEREGRVTLDAIDKPQTKWESPLAAFKAAYEHEQKVTDMIGKLVDLAGELNDHASKSFLQWYVDEQVEEEASAKQIVDWLEMIGSAKHALLMLDVQLGKRGGE